MLNDEEIASRRLRYGCCAIDYLDKHVEASIHGDRLCAERNWRLYLYMEFAKAVMDDTPIGDEDGCTGLDFATAVAAKADCVCRCGCPEPDNSIDCTIVPDFTADVAVSELPEFGEPNTTYYLLTGEGEGNIFEYVENENDGFDYELDNPMS